MIVRDLPGGPGKARRGRETRRRAAGARLAKLGFASAVLGLAVAAAGPAGADQGVTVTAGVDAREIMLGETVRYTISVQGAGMSGVTPGSFSGLSNLQVVSGPNTQTSFSFSGGGFSSSKSFWWLLAPQGTGKARIPAIEVRVGDKIYRTEAIEIEIAPQGSRGPKAPPPPGRGPSAPPGEPRGAEPGPADLRLENELSSSRVYVGQPVVLTTRLLTRVAVVDVSGGPDPTLPGFYLEETETNVVPERVFREGREYQSYVLLKRVLTPTRPGTTVIPAETRTIRIRAGARDVFDSFFAPRVTELTRSSAPVTVEALAPPAAGRPADFSGAAGVFRMDVSADRAEASVGDAVGLKITLSGTGNLRTAEGPLLAPTADFRLFDPRVEEKASGTAPRTYTKTWSYVITPLSHGDLALPTVSFSYFDTAAGSYKRLSSPNVTLTVQRTRPSGEGSLADAGAAGREIQALGRDIRFLKPLDAPLKLRPRHWSRLWEVWLLLGLAILMQPAAWLVRARGGLSGLVPGGRRARARRRALAVIAGAGLERADASVAAGAAWRAIQRFLAERCGIDAQGMTYEKLSEGLARRGVSAALLADLVVLLEQCDLDRFAPAGERRARAEDLLARARSMIDRLDREIGRAA